MSRQQGSIIVKKVKKAGHAHHGGAWKIAYADFVTAMMAFFLLLWLINMTTPEQKEGLANYFAPPNISESTSGSGGAMGGRAMDDQGSLTSSVEANGIATIGAQDYASTDPAAGSVSDGEAAEKDSAFDLSAADPQMFHSAAASIRQAWEALPDITEIADNLIVEVTENGLDIHIPMNGCAAPLQQLPRPSSAFPTRFASPVTRPLALSIQIRPMVPGSSPQTAPIPYGLCWASSGCPMSTSTRSPVERPANRSLPTILIWRPMSGSGSRSLTSPRPSRSTWRLSQF